MENNGIGKYTRSFGLSFAITSVLSALLVVLKESNEETVLHWMKAATGHHWVTHGIINLIVFVALGWVFSRFNSGEGIKLTAGALVCTITSAVVLSGLIITGFYV
jgi:lipoprotein signal peptidase